MKYFKVNANVEKRLRDQGWRWISSLDCGEKLCVNPGYPGLTLIMSEKSALIVHFSISYK